MSRHTRATSEGDSRRHLKGMQGREEKTKSSMQKVVVGMGVKNEKGRQLSLTF